METPVETPDLYRRFAEECRHLANKADAKDRKVILQEMAGVWLRLAAEAEEKQGGAKR